MDSKNDEYEEIPLREGEYLIHPDPRIASIHKRIAELEKKDLLKDLPKGG